MSWYDICSSTPGPQLCGPPIKNRYVCYCVPREVLTKIARYFTGCGGKYERDNKNTVDRTTTATRTTTAKLTTTTTQQHLPFVLFVRRLHTTADPALTESLAYTNYRSQHASRVMSETHQPRIRTPRHRSTSNSHEKKPKRKKKANICWCVLPVY